jgi:hypothetical protein
MWSGLSSPVSLAPVRTLDAEDGDVSERDALIGRYREAGEEGEEEVREAETAPKSPLRSPRWPLLLLVAVLSCVLTLASVGGWRRWRLGNGLSPTGNGGGLGGCSPSSSSPSPSLPPLLSAGEREAVLALTGHVVASDGVSLSSGGRLSLSSIEGLRARLRSVAVALLHLRPALQRQMWVSDCQSFVPCPVPSRALREADPAFDDDRRLYAEWMSGEPVWASWARSTLKLDSSDSAESEAVERLFGPPTASTPWKLLGETAESTELAARFQSAAPPLCW